MMIFKKAIPRRTFLQGAGAMIALPLLESMVPAFAAVNDSKRPTRVSYIYVPNGRIMKNWTPATEGTGYVMPRTLEPLAPFRDQMNVLSGLNIKAADPKGAEAGGNHARSCGAYLTGAHPKQGGISVDQVIAKEFGKHTQLASLELTLDPDVPFAADGVYSAYYMDTISWRSATTPLPMEVNPRAVFERMFGDSDTSDPAARVRRSQTESSILDSVVERVAALKGRFAPADQVKLAEYLDAIRDLERRIQVAERQDPVHEEVSMMRPSGMADNYTDNFNLMADLQVLAFQSDMTRMITFMMGRDQTDRAFIEIGVGDGHHALSHHKDDVDTVGKVEQIDLYQSKLFASYLNKLRSTNDGDGSLLDHSIIVYGSSLGDGNHHVHHDVATLIVGGGSGTMKGGRHLKYPGVPFSNLHMTVMDMVGVPTQGYTENKICDATGKLEGLSA